VETLPDFPTISVSRAAVLTHNQPREISQKKNMKLNFAGKLLRTGIFTLTLCCAVSLHAAILNWSVTGTYTGSGTLDGTYVSTALGANAYAVTSISGFMNGSAIDAGPTSYAGAQPQQIVFDSTSWVGGYLNWDLAFSTVSQGSWKFDRQDPNTGFQTFAYAVSSLYGGLNNEHFTITGYAAPVPEASSFAWCAGFLALLPLGVQSLRRLWHRE